MARPLPTFAPSVSSGSASASAEGLVVPARASTFQGVSVGDLGQTMDDFVVGLLVKRFGAAPPALPPMPPWLAAVAGSGDQGDSDSLGVTKAAEPRRRPSWLPAEDDLGADLGDGSDDGSSDPGGDPNDPFAGWPEYFRGAGQAEGLEVWRIESMVPVRLDREAVGDFFRADSCMRRCLAARGGGCLVMETEMT